MKNPPPDTVNTGYKNSSYFSWSQEKGESPVYAIKPCRHSILGIRVKEVPEFNELQDQHASKNYLEALLRQKTLIETVNSFFLSSDKKMNACFELRLSNDPVSSTISCCLLLRIILTSSSAYFNPNRLLEEFRQMLPDEYLTENMTEQEVQSLLLLDEKQIVEIRRAVVLLPVGSMYHEESYGIPAANLAAWDKQSRYQLPCAGYIEPKTYNLSVLYKLMQNANEKVQLRISLGSNRVFEFEKNISLQYCDMIRQSYAGLQTERIMSYERSFSKYIAVENLFSMKIQVAAISESVAYSIANAFCGQLSYGDMHSNNVLRCIPLKGLAAGDLRLEWEECNHTYFKTVNEIEGLGEADEYVGSFVQRMPYLCDISEAVAVFRLPVANAAGLPGVVTRPVKPFYQPAPTPGKTGDRIPFGQIITSADTRHHANFSVPVKDLPKHGLIVGTTGSGKTNTTLNFANELAQRDIHFLLIEPVKSEYYDRLLPAFQHKKEKLNRFQLANPWLPGGKLNPQFLRFNPFIAQRGITTFQHLSYIKSCFMAAFPMYGILPTVLEDCLYEYYRSDKKPYPGATKLVKGLPEKDFFDAEKTAKHWVTKRCQGNSLKANNDYLTLPGFSEFVVDYLKINEKLFDAKIRTEIEGSINRRLVKLTKGLLGQVLSPEKWREGDLKWSAVPDNIDILLNKSCIVELEALPDSEDKALIMAFLLTYLFESRQTRKSHDPANPLHVTIVEEAHRLLSSSSQISAGGSEGASLSQNSGSKTVSLFIDMLAEIRSKNESIFIVEQIPTKLVADVIKNTNLKVMHRLPDKSDRDYLGETMNMEPEQSRYAATLQPGEALVFEEQLNKPVLVKIHPFKNDH